MVDRLKRKTRLHGGILLQLTLSGLPELDLYENEDDARAALTRMGREAGDPGRRDFWIGLAALIAAGFVGMSAMRYLVIAARLPLPRWGFEALTTGGMLLVAALALRFLHRSGASAWLRRDLLGRGVPVCMGCGYSLRGLPLSTERCPECGRPFDETVRNLLQQAAEGGRDEGRSTPSPS